MNLNQIIKVIFAGIFTFLVIGSLSSISNSIFLEKVIDNLSTLSTAKLNKLREEFFNIQSLLDENKKILTHTVVGREELMLEAYKDSSIVPYLQNSCLGGNYKLLHSYLILE